MRDAALPKEGAGFNLAQVLQVPYRRRLVGFPGMVLGDITNSTLMVVECDSPIMSGTFGAKDTSVPASPTEATEDAGAVASAQQQDSWRSRLPQPKHIVQTRPKADVRATHGAGADAEIAAGRTVQSSSPDEAAEPRTPRARSRSHAEEPRTPASSRVAAPLTPRSAPSSPMVRSRSRTQLSSRSAPGSPCTPRCLSRTPRSPTNPNIRLNCYSHFHQNHI